VCPEPRVIELPDSVMVVAFPHVGDLHHESTRSLRAKPNVLTLVARCCVINLRVSRPLLTAHPKGLSITVLLMLAGLILLTHLPQYTDNQL